MFLVSVTISLKYTIFQSYLLSHTLTGKLKAIQNIHGMGVASLSSKSCGAL